MKLQQVIQDTKKFSEIYAALEVLFLHSVTENIYEFINEYNPLYNLNFNTVYFQIDKNTYVEIYSNYLIVSYKNYVSKIDGYFGNIVMQYSDK